MSANTYHAREGVSVQAEVYKRTQPQIVNTIVAGTSDYLITKDRRRVQIQPGDMIVRGADGQVDAMPAALFHELFEIDAAEVAEAPTVTEEVEAAQAIADEASEDSPADDAAAKAEAQAAPKKKSRRRRKRT